MFLSLGLGHRRKHKIRALFTVFLPLGAWLYQLSLCKKKNYSSHSILHHSYVELKCAESWYLAIRISEKDAVACTQKKLNSVRIFQGIFKLLANRIHLVYVYIYGEDEYEVRNKQNSIFGNLKNGCDDSLV